MQTTVAGKWPRDRAVHRPSPVMNTPDCGQVGLVRERGGLIRGRGEEVHGRGGQILPPYNNIYRRSEVDSVKCAIYAEHLATCGGIVQIIVCTYL